MLLHIAEYLYSCDKPIYGKELARFLGTIMRIPWSEQERLKLDIVGFGKGSVPYDDPVTNEVVYLVSPEGIHRHFGQILQSDLSKPLERHLELAVWERWINDSTLDLQLKERALSLLRKVSCGLLWKVKKELDPETDFAQTAVVKLLGTFRGSPTIISKSFQTELAKIISYLQKYLPDFDVEDVRFGDTYDLIDPWKTEVFNFHYTIALLIKLMPFSANDNTSPEFLQAVRRLETTSAACLVKANSDIDYYEFSRLWVVKYY